MDKKILIVDDEESIVTLLEYNLRQAGFDVLTAYDGEEGFQRAKTESPNLIVLDLMLPKWMVWKYVKSCGENIYIPLFLC